MNREAVQDTNAPRLGRPRNEPGIKDWSGLSLRIRRTLAGYTAATLAEEVDVTQSTVLRWESGTNAPDAYRVAKLARLLDCEAEALARDPKIV